MKKTSVFKFLFLIFLWSANLSYSQSTTIDSLLNKGKDEFKKASFVAAQKLFLQALSLSEKKNDLFRQAQANENIGMCHYYLRDKKTALKWLHRALKINTKSQFDSLTARLNYYIGVMYVELIQKDSADFYTYKAIRYWETTNNYTAISKAYSILSEFYILKTDYQDSKKAQDILSKAEKYALLSKDKGAISFVAMKQHMFYFFTIKDYKRALQYVSKVEELTQDSPFSEDLMYAYRFKAICLAKLQDTAAADYMIKWFEFKDSIFNTEKTKELSKYEKLYETHKKEQKIAKQKLQIQKEKTTKIIYISSLSFIVMTLLIFMVFYRRKQRVKTQKLLQEQHEKSVRDIFDAEQKERIRIARDLHDSIGQKLAVMKMLLPSKSEFPEVEKVANYLDETTAEVRSISHNLIPEILSFGIVKAAASLAERINSAENIQVSFLADDSIKELQLSKQTELSLYRIIQEITSNIVRHSKTKELKIELKQQTNLFQIIIADNGVGFDNDAIDSSSGLGWKNIYARIKLVNGNIKIHSEKNKGSNFLINIPVV